MAKPNGTVEKHVDKEPRVPVISQTNDVQEAEVDLVELMYQLLAHIRFILLSALVCATLMCLYTFWIATPLYMATSKLYVVNSKDSALNLSDLQIGSYLASDYIEVFKTWEVHEMVLRNLGLPYTYSEIESMLEIENPAGTRILYITATSSSALEAAAIANEYASVALKYIANTMATDEPNIMSVALIPVRPSSPNKTRDIVLGLAAGLFLSIGWVTLRFVMDDKIKSVDDIRKYTGMPVLAVVPTLSTPSAKKSVFAKRGDNP